KEGNEACDDGNTVSCDGCKGDCTRVDKMCRDGIVECGEACDDGNTGNGDGCSATCVVESGYTCAGSPSVCTPVVNGCNVLNCPGSYCDGNERVAMGCNSFNQCVEVVRTTCEHGCNLETGECNQCSVGADCDDGNPCTVNDCRVDGFCDYTTPDNNGECDACVSRNCECSGGQCVNVGEGSCGNGVVDFGEECDGGGDTDSCDSDCTNVECRDGHVNLAAGEECDGGNNCNDDCTLKIEECTIFYQGADDNGCPIGQECQIRSCNDYNWFAEDGGISRENACKTDCAGAVVYEEGPNGEIGNCVWGDVSGVGKCFFAYSPHGSDAFCRMIYDNSDECVPGEDYRVIDYRTEKINEEGAVVNDLNSECKCDALGSSCSKSIICPRPIRLPFFTTLNVLSVVVLIALIYFLFLKSKKDKKPKRKE
ncbi:MAG: hypothetical protein ABIG28_01110, partial [archaeon]